MQKLYKTRVFFLCSGKSSFLLLGLLNKTRFFSVPSRSAPLLFAWHTKFQQSLCVLMFYIPVNSYGHVEMVSSPNHTFSWASLTKRLTSRLLPARNLACN